MLGFTAGRCYSAYALAFYLQKDSINNTALVNDIISVPPPLPVHQHTHTHRIILHIEWKFESLLENWFYFSLWSADNPTGCNPNLSTKYTVNRV